VKEHRETESLIVGLLGTLEDAEKEKNRCRAIPENAGRDFSVGAGHRKTEKDRRPDILPAERGDELEKAGRLKLGPCSSNRKSNPMTLHFAS
jgi:hypothetical protein